MRASIQIILFTWPGGESAIGPAFARVGRAADEAGFDTVWVMDHFFQLEPMLGPADSPMLEAYSALSYLAGVTERVRLGTLVTGVIYRYPGLLAKTVTTLDVLSGGRAWLGIGAGWYQREAEGLGFPFPPLAIRFEQLEETLRIVHQMWKADKTPIEGVHFRLAEPINSPGALSEPHPPILIGGSGERKTLRLVAEYADACNLSAAMGPDELSRKLAILRGHCEEVGRDYAEISKTVGLQVNLEEQSTDQVIDQCKNLAALGFDHTIFGFFGAPEVAVIQRLGQEVVPALAGF
ncbi:MAG: LLM class F420-dependent oxidoreductase [Actinomycetota bacterium]